MSNPSETHPMIALGIADESSPAYQGFLRECPFDAASSLVSEMTKNAYTSEGSNQAIFRFWLQWI